MAQAVNLNFHQTFKPECHYVSAILEVAGNEQLLSVKDISLLTGIPTGESSGKVEPHIMYASYMGLIEYEKTKGDYCLKRTKLGEIVFMEDPGLQEKLTILLCHCMMLREKTGAPLWSVTFRNIMPRYRNSIDKELFIKELDSIVVGKVTTKNVAPFFGSYSDFFDVLGILSEAGNLVTVSSTVYDKDFIYLYAFVLFEYWKERYANQDEITSTELDVMHFGEAFGWSTEEEYKVLEHLADEGFIRMNRQLFPYTILKLTDSGYFVDMLYSKLN